MHPGCNLRLIVCQDWHDGVKDGSIILEASEKREDGSLRASVEGGQRVDEWPRT